MSLSNRFPFTVVFTGKHGQRTFATLVDLAAWVEKEATAFRPMLQVQPSRGDGAYGGFLEFFRNIEPARAICQRLLSTDAQAHDVVNQFNGLDDLLGRVYLTAGVPPSDSLEYQSLAPIVQEDDQAAIAALFALSSPTQQFVVANIDAAMARGFGLASSLRFRLFEGAPSAALNQAVDATLGSVKAQSDTTYVEVLKRITLVDDTEERARRVVAEGEAKVAQAVDGMHERVEEEIQGAAKAIADFKSAYQAEIALKEPVSFWQDKANRHRTVSRYFGLASLGVGGVFAVAAWFQLPSLLAPKVQAAAKAATSAGDTAKTAAGATVEAVLNGAPSYFGIALAVLFSTLALWLLRILVRGYLSEMHLKTDAEERVAMVKTYLALMESGKAPTDTLSPVLMALFRPASDGIVKDDSMPFGLAEILSKQR